MRCKLIILICLFLLGLTQQSTADLVGYWPLNAGNGDQAVDRTGNGHTGAIEGATWTSPGWDGEGVCLEFDGVNDLVRIPDAADLRFGSDAAYTLTGWVHVTALPGAWAGVITKGRDTANWYGIWINDGNQWVFGHGPNNQIGSPVVAGVWTHVAVVYDNSLKQLYLNGQLDNETTASATGDEMADLVFGAALGVTEFAPIRLNEVRIYSHALNPEEIVASMQSLSPPELATDPVPENNAVDIYRDGDLSWTPGISAATHDVYFATTFDDVNDASRNAPGDALVSQGQTAATFELDRLDVGQTYYWRVDEVNGAPDFTIFKGSVWSFTTEPLAYPITNILATASSSHTDDMGPAKTIDGSGLSADGRHSVVGTDMWLSGGNDPGPVWIQYEFDGIYQLHQMRVWNSNQAIEAYVGFGVKDVVVETSTDGVDWTVVEGATEFAQAPGSPSYTSNTTVDFGGVMAKFVKITITDNWGVLGQYSVSEVQILSIPVQARQPQPADDAVGVAIDSLLGWRPGREAVSHEVYLSTDEAAVVDGTAPAETVTDSPYDAGILDLDTTYFWKVNEIDEAGTVVAGPVWSFTTQAHRVVEDFEGFTDDEGNRIYETWIDGWENGTGSQVGYASAPFAETAIVHGGRKSMPLLYENIDGLTIAEAERTFDPAQNWAAGGIKSLSLYFRGASDNTGQLYVKINNGTPVPYNGDAADIARAIWQPWNIDLSTVDGGVANVKTLTIGVENAGAKGIVYIDDLRLYPTSPEMLDPVEPNAANLLAHYRLDGNANDSSGNGYDGTEIDGVTYVTGIDSQGLQLDGLYDYIDFGTPADWPAGTEPRSLCGWAMTNTVTPGWRWIAAYGNAVTSQAMFIGLNGADLYGGGYGDDVMLPGFWAVGEWHHIGLTYDGTTARLYADGIEVAAEAKNWDLVPDRAHIGRMISDDIEFWMGVVDEVRLYDKALSAEELAWLAGRRTPVPKPF